MSENARDPREACVSVIIPTHNCGTVIGSALASVRAQTRAADEIIVVDDGSQPGDATQSVCVAAGPSIRYVRQENRGASTARNAGVAMARGEWLAFLDADDTWDAAKLEMQLTALAENPEADFCITASRAWSTSQRRFVLCRWDGTLDPDQMRAELLVRNIFSGLCSSILIRRSAFRAVGGFADGKAAEDRRLAIALLERFRGLLLPHPLIEQRPGPAHWREPERHRREMLRLIQDHDALYRSLDPAGRLLRRATARVYERTGMHYLENGDVRSAARELMRAAALWPLLPNPWRVLINGSLGRLKLPRRPRRAIV